MPTVEVEIDIRHKTKYFKLQLDAKLNCLLLKYHMDKMKKMFFKGYKNRQELVYQIVKN